MWKKEKQIQRIKYTIGVPFPEARKMIEASVPAVPSDQSLANVAKPTTITKAHT